MANFSQSFTGRGTAVILPESGALKTQEGLSKMVLDAEKLRYEVYQKNRSEFLKNARIDPMFILSKSAKEYVGGLIKNFNDTYGEKAQESNYNLSFQDQMDMQTAHDFIESEKSGVLADQDLIKQQKAVVDKDMGMNLNSDEFLKAYEDYLSGDKKTWDYTLESFLKPKDFGMKLREIAMKQPYRIPNITKERPSAMIDVGMGKIAEEYYTVAEDQVDGLIASVFANYPAERKDAFMKWESEDKAKYDYDILKWLKEKYSAEARPLMTGAATTKPGAGRAITTGFNTKLPVSPTNNRNAEFTDIGVTQQGAVTFNHFYNLGRKSFTSDPQTITSYLDLATNERKTLNKATRFEVVGYSSDKDMLIVKTVDRVTGLSAGKLIGLDAERYNDLLIDKPFNIVRSLYMGKPTTEQTDIGLR